MSEVGNGTRETGSKIIFSVVRARGNGVSEMKGFNAHYIGVPIFIMLQSHLRSLHYWAKKKSD
jgi:hypothetical protein